MSIIKVNSIQPASGTTVSITGLSLEGTDIVSGSSIATSEQGAIALTTNGVAATELDLGVKTDDSPQFTGINLGHASDTTLTRASSGDVNIEGNLVYRAGGTDVPVADGGTGASSLTDGGVLLGSGTGAITAMSVLADGEMIVGDGTTDPVAESGATLRTSIGVGTGNSPQFTGIELGHASDSTITRVSAGVIAVEGATVRTGTVGVDVGGTGATSLTDGGILLGSGTDAVTAMAVLADGEMIVGDGTTDPVAESGATLRTSIGVGTGDSPQLTGIELGHASDTTLTRASSGDVNIEGNIIYRAGGTDVPVADGGTGASTLTDGGVLLGSGTGAITAMAVLGDGEMIVGDGTTDPVAESGATLRTSIGVGTGDSPQFTGIELGHASDTTITRVSAGVIAVEGTNVQLQPSEGAFANGDKTKLDAIEASADVTDTANVKTALNASLGGAASIGNSSDTITIPGNLTVTGTKTELQVANLNVEDLNITVASGSADSAAADGAGLTVGGAAATLLYSHSGTKWVFNKVVDVPTSGLLINGTAVTSTAAELNLLDGVSGLVQGDLTKLAALDATAAELNLMDGGTSATSTTVASGDRLVLNDNGTMVQIDVDDLDTYFAATSKTLTNKTVAASQVTEISNLTAAEGEQLEAIGSTTISATQWGYLGAFDQGLTTTSHARFHCLGIGTAASTTTGEIRATADITAYYSSDERLKENIVPLKGALDKVNNLTGVNFDWKDLTDEERKTIHSHEGSDIGVIAQEVQAQYPELVQQREHGYLAVDYQKLTAVLIEAVKELSQKVTDLESKV